MKRPDLLRIEEADELVRAVKNPITKALAAAALMDLRKLFRIESPVTDFDVAFFVKALIGFMNNHAYLEAVLSGQNMDVFDDNY